MTTPVPEPIEERWTTAGPYSIFARVSAGNPANPAVPIVLVHGFAVSGRSYVPTLVALAGTYRVFAPDLPGYGKSPGPERVMEVADLADALAAWLDAEQIRGPVLAGHSLGGQIVAELAHRHPGRIRQAVLIAPTGDPRARFVGVQLVRLARDAVREPAPLIRLVVRDYLRFGLRRGVRMLRSMNAHPMCDRLAGMTMPVLLVTGGRDPIAPPRWRREAVRLLPNGELVEIPGEGHGVQYTAGDRLAGAIRRFVDAELNADAGRASGSDAGPAGEAR